MAKRLLFLFPFTFMFLSGCWDVEEAERMNYVHGVAVDYADGEVVVSLQLANLDSLSMEEAGGQQGSDLVSIAKAKGKNINEAIFEIYNSTQWRLFWGHLTFIIVTERALKHGKLENIIDLVDRYRETRYRIMLFSTQDDDVDKILEVTPVFDNSVIFTRLTDLDNVYEQSSRIKEVSMRELIIQLKEPGYVGTIPTVSTEDTDWKSREAVETMAKITGVALMYQNELQGFITDEDVDGLRWLTKGAIRNNVQVEKDGVTTVEAVIVKPSYSIKPIVKNEEVSFQIKIRGKAAFNELVHKINQDEVKKQIEEKIKEEIKRTYMKALELHSDIYRLEEVLYRKHVSTWKRFAEAKENILTEESLVLDVKIDIGPSKIDNERPALQNRHE